MTLRDREHVPTTYRMWLIAVLSLIAQAAEPAHPSQLYIVSVYLTDNGPSAYYHLLELQPNGSGSFVRYTSMGLANNQIILRTASKQLPKTVSQLTAQNNPCAVSPGALKVAVQRFHRSEPSLLSLTYGIVAQCGASSVTFAVPAVHTVDIEGLNRAHPEVSALWMLELNLIEAVFGRGDDVFPSPAGTADLEFQKAGQVMVPLLRSGRYDGGLTAAFVGNVVGAKDVTFASLLTDYHGPVSAEDAKPDHVQLVNANEYQFARYVSPRYPPLAMQARVQGRVEVQLTVDRRTGEVQRVMPLTGHPLLLPSAIEAARHWLFKPNQAPPVIRATLDFSLDRP